MIIPPGPTTYPSPGPTTNPTPGPTEDQECASKLFKAYSNDAFQVGTKGGANALIATIKKEFNAIKADYRAAKKNLKRLKRAL
jgi:hypothetical protein